MGKAAQEQRGVNIAMRLACNGFRLSSLIISNTGLPRPSGGPVVMPSQLSGSNPAEIRSHSARGRRFGRVWVGQGIESKTDLPLVGKLKTAQQPQELARRLNHQQVGQPH